MAKGKTQAYRWRNPDTGTHYTVRMSRDAYAKLKDTTARKFDPKEGENGKHVDKFKLERTKK